MPHTKSVEQQAPEKQGFWDPFWGSATWKLRGGLKIMRSIQNRKSKTTNSSHFKRGEGGRGSAVFFFFVMACFQVLK